MFSQFQQSEFELGALRLMQDSRIGNTNRLAAQRIVPRELLASPFSRGIEFTICGNWCCHYYPIKLTVSIDRDRSALEIFAERHPGTSTHPFRSTRQVKDFYARFRYL
jgi:hypothetical protein